MSNYRKRISAALCALAFAVSCLGSVSAAAVDEFSGDTVSDSFELLASGDVAINESNFPDATFRQYVSDNFDTDNSGTLSQAELDAVTEIDVSGTYETPNTITDLTGIENFANLRKLSCNYNRLTSLDVSKNTSLQVLECDINHISSLDVSKNTNLYRLCCSDNQFTSIDISQNTALTYLSCYNNQIKSLDVSKNTKLTSLLCGNNQITSLDVSKNVVLDFLSCYNNQLTELNVSNNAYLSQLSCPNNQLTSLDVSENTLLTCLWCNSNQLTSLDVNNNTALTFFNCSDNQLTGLDVSKNTDLKWLYCSNNQLTSLDLSKNSSFEELYSLDNTYPIGDVIGSYSLDNLPAGFDPAKASEWNGADYDEATNSLKNFTSKTVTYKYDCGYGDLVTFTLTASSIPNAEDVAINDTNFPDATFRQYVSDNFDTDNSGGLSQEELDAVTEISVKGTKDAPNNITSLKGIEYFTKLQNLYCYFNQLTSLDVSKNTALIKLYCSYNQLTSLDVSKNTALTELFCNNNQLTGIDVSKNTALTDLFCDNNKLTSLDVSKNTAVIRLGCSYNQLTSLDVSRNTALEWLFCYNNQLTCLDVSKNTALQYLYCNSNQLTSLDLSSNTNLTTLDTNDNTYSIGNVIGSYSLDNLPAGFDSSKASNWTGADYDAATNSLKNFTSTTVTYDYDCGYGAPVTFTLTASSYTAPTPEKTVPVLNVTPVSGGAEVTWDAIPGADMYWLYVFGTNGLVTETPVFGTSAAVTGLTPGQSYGFVAISCINGAWDFNWTAEDLAYAFIPPEKTVPKLNVTSISGGVNVSWDAVPGAGMYWLYVFGDNGLVTETPVFGTSQTVMGLTPGQGYAFVAISYINGAWDFNWTADDLVYAFVPPERTVPVLNVTPVSGGANVSWDAVPGADMYWLYVFGSNGLVTEMPVYSIYGTSTTVIGLTSGQGYAFVAISYINGAWDFNWTANDLVYAIAG